MVEYGHRRDIQFSKWTCLAVELQGVSGTPVFNSELSMLEKERVPEDNGSYRTVQDKESNFAIELSVGK